MVEELRVVPSAMSLELSCRPPGWQNVPIHRTCCNCETYGWTFDKQDVQQCQRCKGVTYCSKICQLEHFNKVHKKHCKYFLGTKVKESSLHNPYTCTKCQHMRALGKHNMTFEEGGLVCIFDYQAFTTGALQLQKNKKVKPAPAQLQIFLLSDRTLKEVPLRPGFLFTQLGEMTGKFSCEFERTVSLLSHIVETIKHCLLDKDPEEKLVKPENKWVISSFTMIQFRRFIWGCILESSIKAEFEWKCSYIFQHSTFMTKVMAEVEVLAAHVHLLKTLEGDLKWFSTFVLVLNFLFIEDYAIHCRLKGRAVPHPEVRDTILTAMSQRLLPYSQLVTIICQGDTDRTCTLCQEATVITAWFPSYLGFMEAAEVEQIKPVPNHLLIWAESTVKNKAFVYLDLYGFRVYCCTSQKCFKKLCIHIRVTRAKLNEEFARSEGYANSSHCGYCFMQCSGRPRCGGCKAKVYCSKDCKEKDWEVHELFCEALAKEKRRYRSKKEIDQNMQERIETQDDLVMNCSKVTETFEAIYDGVCNDETEASVAEIGQAVVDRLGLEAQKLAAEAEVD